ncbi:MAG: SgcJ/EcaC family oxidoreductase [Bryobacteraceae bacterium]
MTGQDDENAIRLLLARLYDAWERGDGAGYAACFAQKSDYITFNGIHLRGQAENAELHGALFRSALRGTKLSAEIESIEVLSSGVALVHTVGRGRKKSYQTYVLVKSGGQWEIRSFQNTRVQPFSVWITRWMQKRARR